jgi:hypothetical protein
LYDTRFFCRNIAGLVSTYVLWMCMNVYECVWMCMNVYECVWMCMNVYECVWITDK